MSKGFPDFTAKFVITEEDYESTTVIAVCDTEEQAKSSIDQIEEKHIQDGFGYNHYGLTYRKIPYYQGESIIQRYAQVGEFTGGGMNIDQEPDIARDDIDCDRVEFAFTEQEPTVVISRGDPEERYLEVKVIGTDKAKVEQKFTDAILPYVIAFGNDTIWDKEEE
jgi:hypothetical protein